MLQASLRLVWILGGATLPHLLTMGDGCPFRPLISVQYLMHDYNTLFMLFCQVYAVSAYLPSEILINVPFAIKFVTWELFSTYIERAKYVPLAEIRTATFTYLSSIWYYFTYSMEESVGFWPT